MADDLEVLFRKARPVDDPVGRYPGFQPGATTLEAGTIVKPGALALPCDILFERDVAIPLRDSTTIYADVFRPVGGKDLPVVIAWSPYGKQGGFESLDHMPLRAGVPQAAVSELQKFEGPDPAYWCAYGYAVANVDVRGAFMSEGDVHFWGSQDARDGYDAIEWLAAREWCNGRVGMAGNSWLAMAQWFIAAERPPHLAAIAPWEGLIDIYRYDVCRGGIPDTGFMERTIDGTCGNGRVEDPPPVLRRHPLMNEYWRDKAARLGDIQVPAYVVASWTNIVHSYGTLQGFEGLGSVDKWLRVHNTMEWPDFYAHQDDLRRFFDRYLKGVQNGWENTPRVRLSVLDPGGSDVVDRPEEDFPLARTEFLPLYLDGAQEGDRPGGTLSLERPLVEAVATYAADEAVDSDSRQVLFTYTFTRDTELAGYLKLRLWVEAQGSDDMDLFARVQKLSPHGQVLSVPTIPLTDILKEEGLSSPSAGQTGELAPRDFTGPDGRLRVSRRALDAERSRPDLPCHSFDHEEPLNPGEIVPVELSLRPIGMRWRAGEQLRLIVAGYNLARIPLPGVPPPRLVNRGVHHIHTGGRYDSHLLLPVTG